MYQHPYYPYGMASGVAYPGFQQVAAAGIPTGAAPVPVTGVMQYSGMASMTSAMTVPTAAIASTTTTTTAPTAQMTSLYEDSDDDTAEEWRRRDKNSLDVEHNEDYNLDSLLAQTIRSSDYLKSLYQLSSFQSLVSEARTHVRNLLPFLLGLSRKPSTAFSVLFKMFTLSLTVKQVRSLIKSKDSALLRGLGFLYLRYVLNPKHLWKWFEPYFDDCELFAPGGDKKQVSMGQFVRSLLIEAKYFNTMLPRIPVKMLRIYKKGLMRRQIEKKRDASNERIRHRLTEGRRVDAEWVVDRQWYEALIDEVLDNGKFLVTFTDYGNQAEISIGQIRTHGSDRHSSSRRRSRDRDRSRSRGRRRDDRSSRKSRRSHSHSRSRSRKRREDNSDLSNLDELIRKEEREKAQAKGRNYARRPTSYYHSLTLPVSTTRKRSRTPERRREEAKKAPSVERDTAKAKVSEEERRKHAKRMKSLIAVYGDASASKS